MERYDLFKLAALIGMIASISVLPLSAQDTDHLHQDIAKLGVGDGFERAIEPGEIHVYHIILQTGEFVRGTVDQRDISIKVKGYFPDGSKIRSFNGPKRGIKKFRFVSEAPGTYRLELHPLCLY